MEIYTSKDLPELLRLLHCVRAKWESIATQLEFSQNDIEVIARKKSHDPSDCLREVITLWLREVDPVPTREQLARVLQSPPVGREDIAVQVFPRLPKGKKLQTYYRKFWSGCLLLVLMIIGLAVYRYQDQDRSSPGKSLSLPVLKQELIGREEEMTVIMRYFMDSEVDVVTLYGQAGFGKSEIALHVGHRMLELGLDVHYIRVENFIDVRSLEKELMEISSKFHRLEKWARGLNKKTLLILDNVDGRNWVNDTSRRQLKKLFLNPLLDNTLCLQILITSQQEIKTRYVDHSYRLHSLSTENCVRLMVYHIHSTHVQVIDNSDSRVICKLVGNAPFAIKVLAKTLSSSISEKYIIQRLNEKPKLQFVANMADEVDEDKLLSAIDLAFQFVKPECQISAFLLGKISGSFILDDVSPYITSEMMRNLNYIEFCIFECLLELTAKSFLEIRQIRSEDLVLEYHFHELIRDYLENRNNKHRVAKVLQAYWKYRLSVEMLINYSDMYYDTNSDLYHKAAVFNMGRYMEVDGKDIDALNQILNHGEFSFEAAIAVMNEFPFHKRNVSLSCNFGSVARVLVSQCQAQNFNYTRISVFDIIQGYVNLLDFVICQEKHTTEWNCIDVSSLCLPIIEKLHSTSDSRTTLVFHQFHLIVKTECLKTESFHTICVPVWKSYLYFFASLTVTHISTNQDFSEGIFSYSLHRYEKAISHFHLTLEDTFSSSCSLSVLHDFIVYITLHDIYCRQDNMTGMEGSLAGIHRLDFQHINMTYCTAMYSDIIIPFLQQVDETKLANNLRSKLLFAESDTKIHSPNTLFRTYYKMIKQIFSDMKDNSC